MLEQGAKYFAVFIGSTLKFIAGPTVGEATGLSVTETALFTAAGMMFTVTVFTLFGEKIRDLLSIFQKKDRKVFSKRSRRFVRIWRKYGLIGVAFLTPLVLSPPGGAFVANAFESHKEKILFYMSISALGWAFIQTLAFEEIVALIQYLNR